MTKYERALLSNPDSVVSALEVFARCNLAHRWVVTANNLYGWEVCIEENYEPEHKASFAKDLCLDDAVEKAMNSYALGSTHVDLKGISYSATVSEHYAVSQYGGGKPSIGSGSIDAGNNLVGTINQAVEYIKVSEAQMTTINISAKSGDLSWMVVSISTGDVK